MNLTATNNEAKISSSPPAIPGLDSLQQQAVDFALKGYSVFLTGPAGSGKSLTLRRIISSLRNPILSVPDAFLPSQAFNGQNLIGDGGFNVRLTGVKVLEKSRRKKRREM